MQHEDNVNTEKVCRGRVLITQTPRPVRKECVVCCICDSSWVPYAGMNLALFWPCLALSEIRCEHWQIAPAAAYLLPELCTLGGQGAWRPCGSWCPRGPQQGVLNWIVLGYPKEPVRDETWVFESCDKLGGRCKNPRLLCQWY